MILLEHQNIKTFWQKAIFQIALQKILSLQKLEILFRGHILSVILKVKKLFDKKELRRIYQKELRVENVTNRKGDRLYVKWKGQDSSFNSWIDKKRHKINE